MGATQDDQILLSALQQLKNKPGYKAKAIAFWLRDLELEKYNLSFSNNQLIDLESLTRLSDDIVNSIVSDVNDSEKMKTGIQEMKEFQFYYTATASLLAELGMERYSQLFALHGISIDVLPLLTESQLVEMGICEDSDRKKILSAIKKIKSAMPSESGYKRKSESKASSEFGVKSVDEILSFINEEGEGKKKRKKKKKKTKGKNNAAPSTSLSSSPEEKNKTKKEVKSQSPSKSPQKKEKRGEKEKSEEKELIQPHKELEKVVQTLEDEEDEEEDLDPKLKAQLDREVEEFRRRLESANTHGTKSKLAPFFLIEQN